MIENRPTAEEMDLPIEFVYSTRIVEMLRKVDLNNECDVRESIKMIEKAFFDYRLKILNKE